ncbi:hypothetical protein [Streptomyces sp. NPDC101455]|uniref:hypothetical protein n=1 Tax=Streptomyces sp. NPDC101455 TaxID=3366142 RepID=UPI003811789A
MIFLPRATPRRPSASTVSRSLSGAQGIGLERAARAGTPGFTVRQVPLAQRADHGGPVTVRWSATGGDLTNDGRSALERGRLLLLGIFLSHEGYAVVVGALGELVLLTPEDVSVFVKTRREASDLLGPAFGFRRAESGSLASAEATTRSRALAEVTLALLGKGTAVRLRSGEVRIDYGTTDVALSPTAAESAMSEGPLEQARRLLAQTGESALTLGEATSGTGAWARKSALPGEVFVLRKDDGYRATGFGRRRRRWQMYMDYYRVVLESAGWRLTGTGDTGWSYYRPGADPALILAGKALRAGLPKEAQGRVTFESRDLSGTAVLAARWVSSLSDPAQAARAEVAVLPYLANVLRRVGLHMALPDEVPGQTPAVYFSEYPTSAEARYATRQEAGDWWVIDVALGMPVQKAGNEEGAAWVAQKLQRDALAQEVSGSASHAVPGVTSTYDQVPQVLEVAIILAAAGHMPSSRWAAVDRPDGGFLVTLNDDASVDVNHLRAEPGVARPQDPQAAEEFDAALMGYAEALSSPQRVVTLMAEQVKVWGM